MADYNIHKKETKECFIFPWKNSNANCALLAGTVSKTLLIRIRHIKTLLKFLPHFMTSASQERIKLEPQKYNNPWITKGIKKSSKRKEKLYEKFLKNRNEKNEKLYKSYKSLFVSVKRKSKRIYYSSKILELKKLVIEKKEVTEIKDIAEELNNFFTNVGPNLGKKAPNSSTSFTSFLNQTQSIIEKNSLSINELKEVFFSWKTNKSPGYDDINFNVLKKCFGEINEPLKQLFNLSLENGIFPEKMKIAKVIPLFKNGAPENIANYRPISVLPCFSKVLERIMYNWL